MKLVKQSIEIINNSETHNIDDIYKAIEMAGRTCYKSENNITSTSSKTFVEMLKNNGHGAMLEHGTVYLYIPEWKAYKYAINKYSKVNTQFDAKDFESYYKVYVTSNYRVLFENDWLDDLEYICEPTQYHEKRISVRATIPIGISREFIRHRSMSFAEMSTRYCNFSKDKFNNCIEFVEPNWFSSCTDTEAKDLFIQNCIQSEYNYMELIKSGLKPQEARDVLPLSTKTELIITGFVSDWESIFNLRCAKSAHPMAQEVANLIKNEFIKNKFIEEKIAS